MRLILLAMLLVAPVAAAQDRPAPDAGTSITGVVYDSIRSRPVAGAIIRIHPLDRLVVADSAGAFRIDSVPPGEYTLIGEDGTLDLLGIVAAERLVVGPASPTTTVRLATLGLDDFARRMCGPDASLDGETGILLGVVRSAVTGSLIAGAQLEITWLVEAPARNALPQTAVLELQTDDHGRFATCAVPREDAIAVIAQAGPEGESAPVEVSLLAAPVARLDLAVAPPDARRIGEVRGVVLDSTGRPLRGVNILLDGEETGSTSDDQGEFRVHRVRLGTTTLLARRPGFAPAYTPVAITATDTTWVTVRMQSAVVLSAVEVRAARLSRVLQEVDRRARSGFGQTFRREELKAFPTYSALFHSVPSVRVQQGRLPSQFVLLSSTGRDFQGRPCTLDIVIDGMPADLEQLNGYPLEALVAVEVYPRGANVPLRYRHSTSGCGAVLVWTVMVR